MSTGQSQTTMKNKYWFDGYIKAQYDILLTEAIPNDWDALIIIFGREGVGKTTFAAQSADYLSNDFGIDYTVFLPEQFEQTCNAAPKGASILWDEAITGGMAAAWASKVSQSIIKMLTQIRKKNLKIIICFPYLHMLNKYFISRCVCSIYLYSKGFTQRGYGYFYNQEQTEDLYSLMKYKYPYTPRKAIAGSQIAFNFKFCKNFILPKDAYEAKKDTARNSTEADEDIWKARFIHTLDVIRDCNEMGAPIMLKDVAKRLKVTTSYIAQLTNKENI